MDIWGLTQFLKIYSCTTSHQPNFSVLFFGTFPTWWIYPCCSCWEGVQSLLFLLQAGCRGCPSLSGWSVGWTRLALAGSSEVFDNVIGNVEKQWLTTFWTGTSKSSASNSSFEARLLELLRSFLKRRTLTDGTRFFVSLESPSSTSLRIATSSPWPVSLTSFVLFTAVKVFEMTPFSTWPTGE